MLGTCPLHLCTNNYRSALDDRGIIPEASRNYCELIVDTTRCLQELERKCSSTDLSLKTFISGFRREYGEFKCADFNISQYRQRNNCPSWPEEHDPKRQYTCSIFGYPHLRTFNGVFETCSNQGAYPLIDNPFFLIQVTSSRIEIQNGAHGLALSKITLLIKSKSGCNDQKIYEASREDKELPQAFIDGFTSAGRNDTILIVVHSERHVEIRMHDISTVIHFRREGPYLGTTLRIPQRLFQMLNVDLPQMCLHGCGMNSTLPIPDILAHPQKWINQCSPFSSPLVEPRLAEEHCSQIGTTDDFFDACVFDQMTSEARLSNLTRTTEHDILHLLGQRISGTGRQSIMAYSRRPMVDFNCEKVVKSGSSKFQMSLFFAIVFAQLF